MRTSDITELSFSYRLVCTCRTGHMSWVTSVKQKQLQIFLRY